MAAMTFLEKFNRVGLAILAVILVGWLVRGCLQRSTEAYGIAKELNAKAGGGAGLKVKSGGGGVDEIVVDGPELAVFLVRIGNGTLFDRFETMVSGANWKHEDDSGRKPVSVVIAKPYLVIVSLEPSPGFVLGFMKGRNPAAREVRRGK